MAYRSKEPSGPPTMDIAVIVGAVVSIAVGFGIFWAQWQAGSAGSSAGAHHASADSHNHADPLAFPPLRIDERKLQTVRRKKYGEARRALEQAGEPHRKLVELVRKANAAQFQAAEGAAQELTARISMAANDVIPYTTYDGFPAAGRPVFEGCRQGLKTLQDALGSGELTPETARTNPPGASFEGYRRNCGQLYSTLVERGLMTERGQWTEPPSRQRALFEILQRFRWAHIIRSRRPPHLQLTDYERRIFFRWRIEDPEAFPMAKREEFLDRVRQDPSLLPDYDIPLNSARLARADGRPDVAAERLRSAIRAHPDRARQYRRTLERLNQPAEESQ